MSRGTRPIRIANCSGFYGDRMSALNEVVEGGEVDVVTGDYLAEVTMLVLAKNRLRDPESGYAKTFVGQLRPVLRTIAERGIKVVVNAGGLNPAALAQQVRTLVDEQGIELSVAHVEGDDVLPRLAELQQDGHALAHLVTGEPLSSWPHEPLTANAYLGAAGIEHALRAGADIVVTGRVADASLIVGAAAWWWQWDQNDHDALAGAVAAGHVIECGTQATGGNFAGFTEVADLAHPGFPLAEIDRDGSAVITKHAGTGGTVTVDTVTAQLLYEIGDPAYLNPDVITHLDTGVLEQAGPDRVRLSGVTGSGAPATTKVAITALGEWQNHALFALTGLDQDEKARLVKQTIRELVGGDSRLVTHRIGVAQEDPADQGLGTSLLKVAVQGTKEAVGARFSAALVEMALASYPGLYLLSAPGPGSSYGVYWPGLIRVDQLEHRTVLPDGTVKVMAPAPAAAVEAGPGTSPAAVPTDAGETVLAALGEVAFARSGDKGGDANVGVWARHPEAWPWLRATLTTELVRDLLPEAHELPIERYELANLHAVNFLVRGLLDAGATSTMRLDKQAKALGEWLRARHVEIPRAVLEVCRARR